jgi:hypothetical protein
MAITSLSTSSLVSGVKRRRVWDQTATTDGFFQIASTTLNVAASSITFSSIPQNYTHLQLRIIGRNNQVGTNQKEYFKCNFNSDTTTANYRRHEVIGDGAGLAGSAYQDGGISLGPTPNTANTFSAHIIDILDYTNTNKYKTVKNICGYDGNGFGECHFNSGIWLSTSAITSINLNPFVSGSNSFTQYTSFALYGVKA